MRSSGLYLNTYTVSFFGHRIIKDPLLMEHRLESLICKLLKEKEYVEFLVGRDGEFDQIVSSTIRRCKRNIRDNEESFREYYDEIEVCGVAADGHFKGAHQTRNRRMVDRSHLVVFCIQHESGGAWKTMKYVQKQGVPYININEAAEEDK